MRKTKKLWFVMLMVAFMTIFTTSLSSSQIAAATLPKVTPFPDDPTKVISKDNSVQMLWQGLYEEKIIVGETTRTAKVYIPKGTNQGARFVLMNVPKNAKSTVDFMVSSGWMDLADERGFCLYVLEPSNGKWGTPKEEMDYITAGYNAERAGKYGMPFSSNYVVGYDDIGADLQKVIMNNPIFTAGAVYLNASEVDDDYIKEMQAKLFKGYNIKYAEVPIPTWVVANKLTAQTNKMIDYWKNANDCTDKQGVFNGGIVYNQDPMSTNIFTPRQKVGKVAVLKQKVNYYDEKFTSKMYDDFFAPVSRYGGGPNGNMLVSRVDYDSLGVDYGTMTVDGFKREYLVYVPKAARESDEKLPVVYAFHGAQTTMQMFFENTLWYEVAEQRNFIVVVPESNLNPMTAGPLSPITKADRPSWSLTNTLTDQTPNNVEFVKQLIKEIDSKYNTDTNRRYSNGHSNGCMFTNYLGTQMSEYFTALGAISGPILDNNVFANAVSTETIPFFMTIGERDMWNWQFLSTAANRNDAVISTLSYWIDRNDVLRDMDYPLTYVNGRYHNNLWYNSDGIPMVRYTMVAEKGHFNIADEFWTIWDEWFALWDRDANGNRVYMGTNSVIQ